MCIIRICTNGAHKQLHAICYPNLMVYFSKKIEQNSAIKEIINGQKTSRKNGYLICEPNRYVLCDLSDNI